MIAAQFALGADCGHAFGDAYPRQAGLELSEGGQDVEEHLAHGVGRVVDLVGAGNVVTLRDLGIFVDEAAEPVTAQDAHAGHAAGQLSASCGLFCCSVRCGR